MWEWPGNEATLPPLFNHASTGGGEGLAKKLRVKIKNCHTSLIFTHIKIDILLLCTKNYMCM